MAMFEGLDQPVSQESPCGPDPELDPEVQNFLLETEAQLPASYRDFNKKAFDARPALKRLAEHLSASRDIRFLTLSAKYLILSDNVQGFSDALDAIRSLLAAQWDHCHPSEAAGGAPLRSAYLQSLDDLPTSVLPLQNATLHNDKRTGAITWRSVLVASKKLAPKPDETGLDEVSVRNTFVRIEPVEQLQQLHDRIGRIRETLAAIRQIFIDKTGYENAPQFEKLPELASDIQNYLAAIIKERAPAESAVEDVSAELTSGQDGGATPESAGAATTQSAAQFPDITSVTEASNALQAIMGYYAAKEPSSPARLLVTQAHQLVGKSFIEAMKILAPAMAEKAKISIGGDSPFTLNFAQLSALAGGSPAAEANSGEARTFTTETRAEATQIMRKVEQFYRVTEPSSPIPLLVEQARNFVAKDFTALMREMAAKPEQKQS